MENTFASSIAPGSLRNKFFTPALPNCSLLQYDIEMSIFSRLRKRFFRILLINIEIIN